ncbi:MAG: hypothetical protein R2710_17020 [Acidimicrobiales bacterium]
MNDHSSTDRPPLDNVTVLDHPLVSHKMSLLRQVSTEPQMFRAATRSRC